MARKKSMPLTDVDTRGTDAPAPVPQNAPANTAPPSLEHIRSDSLRVRADAARTITELEAWRDEIDATIAFLKAQRK